MNGIHKVMQRIQTIENRFQAQAAMPVGSQTFAKKLAEARQTVAAVAPADNNVATLVQRTAAKHGVDPKLALAVASVESSLDAAATSPVGAAGIMQLMPDTARALGVKDIYDVNENIDGGIRYLKQLLGAFGGDIPLALAAYNAGPEAVKEYGGVPPYKETREYVAKVLADYKA